MQVRKVPELQLLTSVTAMKKKHFGKTVLSAAGFLRKRDHLSEILSFFSLFAFSSAVFYLLSSWDMIVRILNARHIFFGGYYYEPMRAPLESFVIGLFLFLSQTYAVYMFIFFVSVVFFLAVWYLSESLKLRFSYLFMFLLSPFVLFYGIKNGSDLLVISFLVLYVSAIMRERPVLAGIFIAMAFASKSYAVMFLPLMLFFLWGRGFKGVFRLAAAASATAASLIPYFIYNFLAYGNFLYSIGLSFLYFHIFSSYVSLGISVEQLMWIPLIGFEEIIFPAALLAFFYLRDRDHFKKNVRRHKKEYSLLTAACLLSFLVYYSVSNLLWSTGLSTFRFILPLSIFLYILAFSFFGEGEMKFVYVFFAASLVIAVYFLYAANLTAFNLSYSQSAVSMFRSVYGGSCTVSSNVWVYFDYMGLDAVPTLSSYANYSGAILSFGSVNTSVPLVKREGNIYLYGYNGCSHYPSLNETRAYYDMSQNNIPDNACYWLFGINPRFNLGYSACMYLNGA